MRGSWLLDEDTARAMRDARRLHLRPSEAQIKTFEDRNAAEAREGDSLPRIMKLAGSTAEIRVEGVLTKAPDIFALFFGGGNTTYSAIIASLAIAQSDPSVKSVSLWVDSPGGTVDGLFETLASLEAFRASKPIGVRAANAMSAAYGIAAVAGRIEAQSAGSRFGSVGVAATYLLDDDVVDITNTDSPDKRPDVKTEEGKAVVRRELDAIHELFVEAIAKGRGQETSAKTVREEFGRGATMLASEAKRRGMIDSVVRPALRAVSKTAATDDAPIEATQENEAPGAVEKESETLMTAPFDLHALKAQHPQVFAAAFAEGEAAERDRVGAHLELGQAGGPEGLKVAFEAIDKGDKLSMKMTAKYQSLAMNRADRGVRQTDDTVAAAALAGASQPTQTTPTDPERPTTSTTPQAAPSAAKPLTDEEMGNVVAARMMERRGKKLNTEGAKTHG